MKRNLIIVLLLTIPFKVHAFSPAPEDQEDQVCSMAKESVSISKSQDNNGSKSKGVLFSHATRIGVTDGTLQGSVLKFLTGDVMEWYSYQGDIQVMQSNEPSAVFFLPNSVERRKADGTPIYPDPDIPEAGIAPIIVDDVRNGVICPESGYIPNVYAPKVDGLYCVRSRHRNKEDKPTYGVVQVIAFCKDHSLVFRWIFNPDGNRNFNTAVPINIGKNTPNIR